MAAKIIDGKAISEAKRAQIAQEVESIISAGHSIALAVVIVGEDPASKVYVRNKARACKQVGISSKVIRLDENTSRFSADVYDATELVPWMRTFICRITGVSFSDKAIEARFLQDIREMYALYGLEGGESE